MPECTDAFATFCPNCGWCKCLTFREHLGIDVRGDGESRKINSACPLHSPSSRHGKHELAETLWGTFDLGGEA